MRNTQLHIIRRTLVTFLTVGLALTSLPPGHAADRSPGGRQREQTDRETGRERKPLSDCSSVESDNERDRDDDRGRRRREECLTGGSSSGIARGDFNGDGFADLAIGVPAEDTPSQVKDSGAVNVIYGSANGLTVEGSVPLPHFFSQNAEGVPFGLGKSRGSEDSDGFGSALAAGDFNKDNFSDLAIGIPFEDNDRVKNSGRVVIIYGSANGLTARDGDVPRSQSFEILDLENFTSLVEGNEEFGRALAWGDFNGDTVGDLAIGAPGLEGYFVNCGLPGGGCPEVSEPPGGGVFVLFGISGVGLSTERAQFLYQGDDGVFEYTGDRFGEALAAGNFDGDADNVTDLAIGIPHDDFPGVRDSGTVRVEFGRLAAGFESNTATLLFPENLLPEGVAGATSQSAAQFGRSLAAGDFDGDRIDDLAIGAPLRNGSGARTDSGAVWVIQDILLVNGVPGPPIQFWEQSRVFPNTTIANELPGSGSPTEASDLFGTALGAGDFNGDGLDDLAIGAPGEDISVPAPGNQFITLRDAGAVTVIYGSSRGLSITQQAAVLWHQGLFGAGDIEADDQFGASLTAWNFGRNETILGVADPFRTADLAIGVPLEDLSVSGQSIENCGQVNVLYGSFRRGLTTSGVQRWHQGSHPELGGREAEDHFGAAVY